MIWFPISLFFLRNVALETYYNPFLIFQSDFNIQKQLYISCRQELKNYRFRSENVS